MCVSIQQYICSGRTCSICLCTHTCASVDASQYVICRAPIFSMPCMCTAQASNRRPDRHIDIHNCSPGHPAGLGRIRPASHRFRFINNAHGNRTNKHAREGFRTADHTSHILYITMHAGWLERTGGHKYRRTAPKQRRHSCHVRASQTDRKAHFPDIGSDWGGRAPSNIIFK